MSTPEELLCSRKWRMLHGAWMLFGWFLFGWTAWIGYLIIGIRASSWKWIATSVGFFIYGLVSMNLITVISNGAENAVGRELLKGESSPEPWSTYNQILFLVMSIVWLGNATIVQWLVNRRWLVWRAHNNEKRTKSPWYATATATSGGATGSNSSTDKDAVIAAVDTAARAPLSNTPPSASSVNQTAAPIATVDINAATRDELLGLPGIDFATAERIISARQNSGGYTNTAELVTKAGVQPHLFADIQELLVVTPRNGPESSKPVEGRRIEF